MRRQVLVALAAIAAILALTVGDCFASPLIANEMAQHEKMKCCASMPCTQASQQQDCCRTMSSLAGQQFTPTIKIAAPTPVLTVEAIVQLAVPFVTAVAWTPMVEIYEHGPPPDLYTFNHTLLI